MKADFAKLDRAFNPQCVAVVGERQHRNFGWLRAQNTFQGKLYSVQVSPEEIEGIRALGIENYTNLLDIPSPVDLVIVAVPRAVTPQILEDCIRKEVAAAHFFTAGFSETGTEEGIRLERLLTQRAKEINFHLIGPNCLGIFNPGIGLRQNEKQYTGVSGSVGFISQSGTHAITFSDEAHLQGIEIKKSVSFGNGVVLDGTDYLEYFGADSEIRAIGMYLEGVRDGRRFLQVLKEVSARKPVVIWKGGRTEAGGRAIATHTASLAVPQAIWGAAVKQHGGVTVTRMAELVDTLKALLYLSLVRGDRVGVTGGSGGQSVAVADEFAETGLRVPRLTQESYDELSTFFSLIGGHYLNPIDTGNTNRREMKHILEILERDANIDNLVLLVTTRFSYSEQIEAQVSLVLEVRKRTAKPVMAILIHSAAIDGEEMGRTIMQKLQSGGVPTFTSLERGARALKNALDYYRHKNGIDT